MTLEELNKLVMEFYDLVSQDFLSSTSTGPGSTFANDLVIKIQSAKLTFALNETEIKMVEFIVERLFNLEKDFAGAIQVYFFQYTLITGNSLEIHVNEVTCNDDNETHNDGKLFDDVKWQHDDDDHQE